jgi:hypothetical protein
MVKKVVVLFNSFLYYLFVLASSFSIAFDYLKNLQVKFFPPLVPLRRQSEVVKELWRKEEKIGQLGNEADLWYE